MPAVNLSGLMNSARRFAKPNRMMGRAAGRWASGFGAGDLAGGWKAMRGSVGAGAWKGAAIGASLGAATSLIDQSQSGGFSVGRTMGGAFRGGLMGGFAGAAFGAGHSFLGRSPAVTARAARMAAMANRPMAMARAGRWMGGISSRAGNFFNRARGVGGVGAFGGGGGVVIPPAMAALPPHPTTLPGMGTMGGPSRRFMQARFRAATAGIGGRGGGVTPLTGTDSLGTLIRNQRAG